VSVFFAVAAMVAILSDCPMLALALAFLALIS
jgi:hypothetical protein